MSLVIKNTYEERAFFNKYAALIPVLVVRLREREQYANRLGLPPYLGVQQSDWDFVRNLTLVIANFGYQLYEGIKDASINFNSPPRIIHHYALDEVTCVGEFRFCHSDLQLVADSLWPKLRAFLVGTKERILVSGRYVIPYETGVLILLFRMSKPRVLRPEMERFFCMRSAKLSQVIKTFLRAFHEVALLYMTDPAILLHRLPLYAGAIEQKSRGACTTVWGFIDGTLRKTCRPIYLQRHAYSGHKRCHGIKYQSVVTPDGLIANLYGPIAGCRHDSYLLGHSELLWKLGAMMPIGGPNPIYSLYGDPAYSSSYHLFSGFRQPAPGSVQARWNTRMSKVREVVEWGFNEIATQWSYLDFKAHMEIFQGKVGMYYIVGGFLCNIRCCLYGNQISNYFNMDATNGRLSLQEYLELVQ